MLRTDLGLLLLIVFDLRGVPDLLFHDFDQHDVIMDGTESFNEEFGVLSIYAHD